MRQQANHRASKRKRLPVDRACASLQARANYTAVAAILKNFHDLKNSGPLSCAGKTANLGRGIIVDQSRVGSTNVRDCGVGDRANAGLPTRFEESPVNTP